MASPALSFVLENLIVTVRALIDETKFAFGVIERDADVSEKLRLWCSLLKDLDTRKSKGFSIYNFEKGIRDFVCRLEDFRDIRDSIKSRRRLALIKNLKAFSSVTPDYKTFQEIKLEIEKIHTRLMKTFYILNSLDMIPNTHIDEEERSFPANENQEWFKHLNTREREGDFYGMKDDIQILNSHMLDQHPQVICIYGMGAFGKTLLARKLYDHHSHGNHFSALAWVNISGNFSNKNVSRDILNQLLHDIELPDMSDAEVTRLLHEVLKDKRCLVVLDDICTSDALEFLLMAFPHEANGNKLLLTTRIREVAELVSANDRDGMIYSIKDVIEPESWQAFCKIAFSGNLAEVDPVMLERGEEIVRLCKGMPSAIVTIGELLATRHTLHEWNMMLEETKLLIRGPPLEQMSIEIFFSGFHDLPYHLKPCFLYLGMFPKGSKIEVEHLYHMWIAEGMVSSDPNEPLMDVAERYFSELVRRNMVNVTEEKTPALRKYRSCSIYERTRDLCLAKGKEYFFEVMNLGLRSERQSDYFSFSSISPARRLALHLSKEVGKSAPEYKNRTSKHLQSLFTSEMTEHLRSLLLLHPQELQTKLELPEEISDLNKLQTELELPEEVSDVTQFTMMRVLKFECFDFRKRNLPKGMKKLIHLRYLSLKGCILKELPSSTCKLSSLWSLDLRVSDEIILPNVLWKLKELTHLYLPLKFNVGNGGKLRLGRLGKLQVLENFDSDVCNVDDLSEMHNLVYLSMTVQGNQKALQQIVLRMNAEHSRLLHPSISIKNFDCHTEEKHSVFRDLLSCRILHRLYMDGYIEHLPPSHKIAESLTELVLVGSQLEEDPMTTLNELEKLEELTLKDDAFVGKEMKCSAYGFKELKCLKLLTLHYLETWEVENRAMPKLSILAVKNCRRLKPEMPPDGLKSRVPPIKFENDESRVLNQDQEHEHL